MSCNHTPFTLLLVPGIITAVCFGVAGSDRGSSLPPNAIGCRRTGIRRVRGSLRALWSRPFLVSSALRWRVISPADEPYFAGSPRTSSADVRYRRCHVPEFRSRVITAMLASLRALTGTPLRLHRSVPGARRSDAAVPRNVSDVHHRCTSGAPVPWRSLNRLLGFTGDCGASNPLQPLHRSHRRNMASDCWSDPRRIPARIDCSGPVLTSCRRWHLAQGR